MLCNTGYLFNNDMTENGYSLLTTSCILNFYQVTSVTMTVATSSARLRPGSANGRGSSGLIEFMNMFLW